MALPIEQVHGNGTTTYEENNEWRFGEQSGGVVSVTIVPDLFNVEDETLRNKYLTGLGPNATTIWIRSGIPLALITEGENSGAYGPYDPDAEDGRADRIAGLLESMVAVNISYTGWDVDDVYVGMRYRGDIIKSKLPVVPAADAVWQGDFYDVEEDKVTPLTAASTGGATTPPAVADGAVTTAKIADKAVTAGKIADGVIPAMPDWATLGKKPAAAAAIADLTAAPTAADVNKILAALRTWGIVANK